jgi:hypothetical protein
LNEYYRRGINNVKLNEYENAIDNFTAIIEIDPKYKDILNRRGVAYCSIGNYDAAISDMTRAIQHNPHHASYYFNLGSVYDLKDNYDDAIVNLTKALEINSKFVMAYLRRADVYVKKGEYDSALFDLAMILEMEPVNLEAQKKLIEIFSNTIWNHDLISLISRPIFFNIVKKIHEEFQSRVVKKFMSHNLFDICLNGTQKNIIEATLSFNFELIAELEPAVAIKALKAMTVPMMSETDIALFKQKEVLGLIEMVRDILKHDCPQNRTENYPYFELPRDTNMVVYKDSNGRAAIEQKGLLSLTARNDTTAFDVIRESVVQYIHKLIAGALYEQQIKLRISQQWEETNISTLIMLRNREGSIFSTLPGKVCEDVVDKTMQLSMSL